MRPRTDWNGNPGSLCRVSAASHSCRRLIFLMPIPQLKLEGHQRKINVPDEGPQAPDQRDHAGDEQEADEKAYLQLQQRGEKQGNNQERRQQHAQACQEDRKPDQPCPVVKNINLALEALASVRAVVIVSPWRSKISLGSQRWPGKHP